MTGPTRYAAILRQPHVTPLLLASMLARLPYGVYALAVILYLSEERDSYAIAGLVDGAFAIGAAVGVPGQGRLIDRFGQRRVLVPAALLDATATGALIVLTESGAATAALVACGLLGGVAIPSVGGALRALWPSLLRRARRTSRGAAFALDSVALEVLFTSGPLLAALVVAVASPVAALVPERRLHRGRDAAVRRAGRRRAAGGPTARRRGPARSARCARAVCARSRSPRSPSASASAPSRSACPRSPRSTARPSWPGSCSRPGRSASVAGGLIYGARSWPGPLGRIYLVLSDRSSRSASCPPCSPARSRTMAVLVVTAGLLHRAAGGRRQRADRARGAARHGHRGLLVAGDRDAVGFAPGTAIGGALVEESGWEACFVAAAAFAALGAVVVWWYRGTLSPD